MATTLLGVAGAPSGATASTVAQSPPAARSWPSGDELRRSLQEIGFTFLVEAESGDWMGWAPRATLDDPAALRLAGAGTRDAAPAFELALLQSDPLVVTAGAESTLTALFEVTARLPIDEGDLDRLRQFVIADLLVGPPDLLEPCYATDWARWAALVTLEEEAFVARIEIASSEEALELEADLDLAECAPLIPSEVATRLGDPSTERLTIVMSGDGAVGFDPSDVSLEGALVTLVLTFRNGSAVPQTLTFEAPLTSTTGAVDPGEAKLIVVRQLPPGAYAFHSETNPDTLRGVVRIAEPVLEDE